MRTLPRALAALLVLPLIPTALAGTLEAPEIADPEGDCDFAPGNEYMDIVAAWVSDETAQDFRVNVALAKWNEPIAMGAGITVQFTHQGVQFGIVALYQGSEQGWYYGNARVNDEGVSEMVDTTGSFQEGAPAVLSVQFLKSHFPHGESADNALSGFWGGSIDLKPSLPFFIAGQAPPFPPGAGQGEVDCDDAEGTAVYTFQVGQHSGHDMGSAADEDAAGATDNATAGAPLDDVPVVPQGTEDANDTPAPGLLAVALGVSAAALARARRSRP